MGLHLETGAVTVVLGEDVVRRRLMAMVDAGTAVRVTAEPHEAVPQRLERLRAARGAALVLVDRLTDGLDAATRRVVLGRVRGLTGGHTPPAVLVDDADVVAALAVLVVATLLAWSRLSPVARDTLWAEDATRFLHEDDRDGLAATLLRPYAGYLHVVPRLLAALVLQVADLAHLAAAVTAAGCLVTGVIGAALTVLTRGVVRRRSVRVVIGLSGAALPTLPHETLGNLANLHSVLLVLAPVLFLARPRGRVAVAGAAVLAALVTLTEIQSALFLPLLLLDRRDRRRWPMAAAAVAGTAAQVVTTLLAPRSRASYDVAPDQVALGYLSVPLPQAWSARTGAVAALVTQHLAVYVVLASAVLLAVGALAVARLRGRRRWLVLALVLGSVATWAAALVLNPRSLFDFSSWTAQQYAAQPLARYATVSASLLAVGLLVLADGLAESPSAGAHGRKAGRVAGAVLVGSLVVGWATGGAVPSLRDDGPAVPPQLPALAARCAGAAPTAVVPLRVAPADEGYWTLPLTCAQVRAGTTR